MVSSTFNTYFQSLLGAMGRFLAVGRQSYRAGQRLELGTLSGDKQLPPVLSVRLGGLGRVQNAHELGAIAVLSTVSTFRRKRRFINDKG